MINSSEERSSVLKRINDCLPNSIGNKLTSELAMLSINNDLLETLSFNQLINEFANLNGRKSKFLIF